MMINRKKAWLVSVIAVLALTFGFSMAAIGVMAATGDTQSVFGQTGATVVMDPGAGIRKDMDDDTENGIRFLATVPNAAYEQLEEMETDTNKVSYGMLIADAADVAIHGELTAETVFGETAVYEPVTDMTTGDASGDKAQVRHFAYDTLPTGEDYSHLYNERMIVGELTDFAAEDLTKELVGIAYIAYSTSDGTEYLFAEDNENSVSMTYVAQVAIEKGMDDDNDSFAALYVDKVPDANKTTTYSIQYLFETDNGEYVADDSIENKVIESQIGEMTSLDSIPESFTKKPGYMADTEKNAGESPQIVYANGKRTVQAYYRRAAVTGINASMNEGAVVVPYTDTDTLRQYITVKETYEDGSGTDITDYTLAESIEESGASVLISGRTGGAYAGKTYMPFSGTVTFTVTAGQNSTTINIPVTSGSTGNTGSVQDFDNADTLAVDYLWGGLASRSTTIKIGENGGAAALKADNGQQYSQANIYSMLDVSEVDTLYYWLYFDSTSFVSTKDEYNRDNLPEIVDRVIAATGLTNWSRESLSYGSLAWDTWIPMRATKNADNTETNVLRVQFDNMEYTWGLSDTWNTNSGFSYTVYLDGISTEEPDLPEVSYEQGDTQIFRTDTVDKIDKSDITVSIPQADGTVLKPTAEELTLTADFLRSNTVTVSYGGSAIGTFEVTFAGTMLLDFDSGVNVGDSGWGGSLGAQTKNRLGDSGYGAGVEFNANMDVGRSLTDLNLTDIDTIYYYVYLDNTVWTCTSADWSSVTLNTVIASVHPNGWTATAQTEVGWNRWILVKADRGTANTTTPVTWVFSAWANVWGIDLRGFRGNVICFDEIFYLPNA